MNESTKTPDNSAKLDFFPIDQLINGIIHNINNPLTIVKIRTQLLLSKYPQNQALHIMLENIGRIESILGNIATKIREQQNGAVRLISLNNLINIEIQYLEGDLFFKHHVTKSLYLQESLPMIRGNYRQISQGLLTVIAASLLNMRDSTTRNLTFRTYGSRNECVLEISDTGDLITPEDLPAIRQTLQDPTLFTKLEERLRSVGQTLLQAVASFGACCREYTLTAAQPVGMHHHFVFQTPATEKLL